MKLIILISLYITSSMANTVFHCSAVPEFDNSYPYEIMPNIKVSEIVKFSIISDEYSHRLELTTKRNQKLKLGRGVIRFYKNGNVFHYIDERNETYADLTRKYRNVYHGRIILEQDFLYKVKCGAYKKN